MDAPYRQKGLDLYEDAGRPRVHLTPLVLQTQAELDRCEDIHQGSSKVKQPATAV